MHAMCVRMSTPTPTFDFIVLGGGSAGYAAARTAHSLGLSVAVVDGAEELGGLCILRGCMPSKTLIESAERNLTLRRAEEFGLKATPGLPDIRAIRERKRALIADFAGYRQNQLADGRFTLLRGRGVFEDAHTLRVTPLGENAPAFAIQGRSFCIATGSVPAIPPVPGLADVGFWTSDEVLDAEALPESFLVLGGGAIALEMAHYLEGMERKVTVLQRGPRFLSSLDPECGAVVEEACRARGMSCHLGTKLLRAERSEAGSKRVVFEQGGRELVAEAAEILVALGRRPASAGLGLEAAGVTLAGQKIAVSGAMRTSQPHIFAAGDVCSPLDVVHVAIQQGEAAARNAARRLAGKGEAEEVVDYRLLLFGVFCHPQVAAVGMNEEALKKAGTPFVSAAYPFNDHGKSMCMGETEGFVKMLAHQHTGEILGASVVGPHATELIHEVVVAMHHRTRVQDFMLIPHYHPTLSEIWTYPAEECAEQLALASSSS